MEDMIEALKRFVQSTCAGEARYRLDYADGSQVEIVYKAPKRQRENRKQ